MKGTVSIWGKADSNDIKINYDSLDTIVYIFISKLYFYSI